MSAFYIFIYSEFFLHYFWWIIRSWFWWMLCDELLIEYLEVFYRRFWRQGHRRWSACNNFYKKWMSSEFFEDISNVSFLYLEKLSVVEWIWWKDMSLSFLNAFSIQTYCKNLYGLLQRIHGDYFQEIHIYWQIPSRFSVNIS